jgi:serine/threonine-protein kinase
MEYIQGESLGALLRFTTELQRLVPIPVGVAIVMGLLNGLHAAHEATDEEGRPLGIIHRDVSPQNVIVGTDGVPRLVDFGVARAASRLAVTRDGQVKGKVPYMAPEQLSGEVSRQTDIYAAGVVLWETLACRRLFQGDSDAEIVNKVITSAIRAPSRYNHEVPPALDAVVLRALSRDPESRWRTAADMAEALDATLRPASTMRVSQWVLEVAEPSLRKKNALLAVAEAGSEPRSNPHVPRSYGPLPVLESVRDVLSDVPSVPTGGLPVADDVSTTTAPFAREGAREPTKTRYAPLALAALGLLTLGAGMALLLRPAPVVGGPVAALPVVPTPPRVSAAPVLPSPSAVTSAVAPPAPASAVVAVVATQAPPAPPKKTDAPRRAQGQGGDRSKSPDLQELLDTR